MATLPPGLTAFEPAWPGVCCPRFATSGILAGAAKSRRKEFVPPAMTPRGFAYVAWREHEQGASSWALVTGSVWHRWLLDADSVDDLFNQSSRLGVLRFSRVGSAVRVDWRVDGLAEATRVAA